MVEATNHHTSVGPLRQVDAGLLNVGYADASSPAWKSSPAWAVVATGDKAAGTDVVRSMAERAGATITEAEGSHVIMVSQPGAVAEVIMTAVAAVGRPAAAAGG